MRARADSGFVYLTKSVISALLGRLVVDRRGLFVPDVEVIVG